MPGVGLILGLLSISVVFIPIAMSDTAQHQSAIDNRKLTTGVASRNIENTIVEKLENNSNRFSSVEINNNSDATNIQYEYEIYGNTVIRPKISDHSRKATRGTRYRGMTAEYIKRKKKYHRRFK